MLKNIIGLLAGLLFGFGLLISGMTDPAKVQGFLDVFGAWDISLALVMGGGLAVAIVGVQFFSLGLIAEMITKQNANQEDFLIEKTL